jgi:hypothetical protein
MGCMRRVDWPRPSMTSAVVSSSSRRCSKVRLVRVGGVVRSRATGSWLVIFAAD